MTKLPALAALSVLLLNCHHAPPTEPAPTPPTVAAPVPAPAPVAEPAAEPAAEPEPANGATVPATRTAPQHDLTRCTLPTRAYPAWCNTTPKDRVKPVKQP